MFHLQFRKTNGSFALTAFPEARRLRYSSRSLGEMLPSNILINYRIFGQLKKVAQVRRDPTGLE